MPSAPTVLYLNNYDTSRLGLVVTRYEGQEGMPSRDAITAPLLGRVGRVVLDGRPTVGVRTLLLPGVISGDTVAIRQANFRALKERLGRGLLEVRFIDQPLVMYQARLTRCTEAPGDGGQAIEPTLRLTIELECQDAYAYETSRQLVALTTTPVRLPLGDAPSPLVIRIFGAATDPVLTLRHANGRVLQTMGLTVTLGANDYVEINSDLGTIVRSVAGVQSEGLSLLTSGDFLVADPGDGDGTLNGGPTLELSTGTGDARWRKAYP